MTTSVQDTSSDTGSLTGARQPFDWWRAVVQVLASIESVRDGRAMYVLLTAFAAGGATLAMAQGSLGKGQMGWAIADGSLGLFIAFYGSNAAGLLLMDRALGRPAREVADAVADALGIGHRVLATLLMVLSALALLASAVYGLFWLCGLPIVGPWLYALVLPTTVVVMGAVFLGVGSVVGPLTGPMVWAGASSWDSVRQLTRLFRDHLLQAVVLMAGLSLVTGLVGGGASLIVLVAGRVMAELSVMVLGVDVPAEILMGGLVGHAVHAVNTQVVSPQALPYIAAANVGGGLVFGLALVLPTLVYLRGVCEIYLVLCSRVVARVPAVSMLKAGQ